MSADFLASAATLARADPRTCDRAALTELVAVALAARAWLDAFDASLAVRAGQLAEPAVELLTGGGQRRSWEAEAIVGRAGVLEAMPALHDALAAGAVSAAHVDAVVRAADRLQPEERADLLSLTPELVASASETPVAAFERDTRQLAQLLSRVPGSDTTNDFAGSARCAAGSTTPGCTTRTCSSIPSPMRSSPRRSMRRWRRNAREVRTRSGRSSS